MGAEAERIIEGIKNLFRMDWLTTKNLPYYAGRSDQYIMATAAVNQQRGYVDCVQQLKHPARHIRLVCTVGATLFFIKENKEAGGQVEEIQLRELLVAGIPMIIDDEDIIKFRIEPVAYPATLTYYISR